MQMANRVLYMYNLCVGVAIGGGADFGIDLSEGSVFPRGVKTDLDVPRQLLAVGG
jgi:hypothetical protein